MHHSSHLHTHHDRQFPSFHIFSSYVLFLWCCCVVSEVRVDSCEKVYPFFIVRSSCRRLVAVHRVCTVPLEIIMHPGYSTKLSSYVRIQTSVGQSDSHSRRKIEFSVDCVNHFFVYIHGCLDRMKVDVFFVFSVLFF